MQFRSLFGFPQLLLYGVILYAQIDQSLCTQCITQAKKELKECLDAAISREDKTSCAEKNDTRTKSCSDGECKIAKAAHGGNTKEGSQEQKSPPPR
ncbi:MAG TPA: hypothetical protein VF078_12345 [Nitrospira sp.]